MASSVFTYLLENLIKIGTFFKIFVSGFRRFFSVTKHPNASERIRTYPNTSENFRNFRKLRENFRKLRENFAKSREKFAKSVFFFADTGMRVKGFKDLRQIVQGSEGQGSKDLRLSVKGSVC